MAHMNSVTPAVVNPTTTQVPSSNAFPSAIVMSERESVLTAEPIYEQSGWSELPPCWGYAKSKEDEEDELFCKPHNPPNFDVTIQYVPDLYSDPQSLWKKCHILSLPKDIRMKIYEYILTDPSNSGLPVGIDRKPFSPSYKFTRPPVPELSFFHPERHSSVSLELLRTNRAIYEEALPILYQNTSFMPSDLEGLLPLFLQTLSPFARSCIRSIYLCIPQLPSGSNFRYDRSKPFFHWAVTCAQVAKLNGSIRQVEISGEWSIFKSIVNRKAILFPLCKIKAKKLFRPCGRGDDDPQDYDIAFQELLVEAEETLKTASKLREERTKAEAMERWKRVAERAEEENEAETETKNGGNGWVLGRCRLNSRSRFKVPLEDASSSTDPLPISGPIDSSIEEWSRRTDENVKKMERALSLVPGIKRIRQVEKELEERKRNEKEGRSVAETNPDLEDWDMIGMASGTSTPKGRPGSVISKFSDETWPDTASTLLENDDVDKMRADKRYESDEDSEDWDYVER